MLRPLFNLSSSCSLFPIFVAHLSFAFFSSKATSRTTSSTWKPACRSCSTGQWLSWAFALSEKATSRRLTLAWQTSVLAKQKSILLRACQTPDTRRRIPSKKSWRSCARCLSTCISTSICSRRSIYPPPCCWKSPIWLPTLTTSGPRCCALIICLLDLGVASLIISCHSLLPTDHLSRSPAFP